MFCDRTALISRKSRDEYCQLSSSYQAVSLCKLHNDAELISAHFAFITPSQLAY